MKITGVQTTPFAAAVPGRTPMRSTPPLDFCLVELQANDGTWGISVGAATSQAAIHQLAEEALIGEDPSAVAGLWEAMITGDHRARAALDVALWDLKSKVNQEPLWQALGGLPPRAKAFANWQGNPADLDAMQAWFARMATAHGITGGCVSLGSKSEWNTGDSVDDLASGLKILRVLQETLSAACHQPELLIDAGGHWPTAESIRKVRAFEQELDITCVRSGVPDGDLLGSKRLADAIYGAVSAGRGLTGRAAFLPWFDHHAANVIEIDIQHLGITGALQVADAAFGFELPVLLCAAPGNMHVHLATVMPNFMGMEVLEHSVAGHVITGDVTFAEGRGHAGDSAGNGLRVNRELLGRHALKASRPGVSE